MTIYTAEIPTLVDVKGLSVEDLCLLVEQGQIALSQLTQETAKIVMEHIKRK